MINKEIIFKIIKSKRFLDIILPIFCIALIAFLSYLFIKGNYFIFTVLTSVLVIGAFILSQFWSSIKDVSFRKFLFWSTIISAFAGPAFFTIQLGSYHLFPFRVFLLSLWFVFILWFLLKGGKLNISHIKTKEYLFFLLFWFFGAFLSLGWAQDKVAAIRNIIFLFTGGSLIFFSVYYLKKLKELKVFYYLWIFVLIILIPIGFWEIFTGNHLEISGLYQTDYPVLKFVPTTTFHNPNDFATFLALTFPFLFCFLRHNRKILKRIFVASLMFCCFYFLFLTGSRANYLAVIFQFLFLFLFILNLKTKVKWILSIALIVLALVIIFPDPFFEITGEFSIRISSLYRDIGIEHTSVGIRTNLIKNSLFCFFNSFGFGVGAGNVEHCIENYGPYWTGGITNVHNWWFEILANYGIFVFFGYMLFYFGLIWSLYKYYKKIKRVSIETKNNNKRIKTEKMICEALLVSLVGFFMASIGSSSVMALAPQWILLAFALAFLNYYRTKSFGTEKDNL